MAKKTEKFLIIDANSLIHRAYHALPPLTTKSGQLVNAVYGFVTIFLKVMREHDPAFVAVCFDMPGGTFRDDIYKDYKAGREEKPQEFYDQFDLIKEFLDAFNVAVFEKQGFEADDLIGTLASDVVQDNHPHIINVVLSGDKDMLQLVNETTEVEIVKKGVSETATYTPSRMEAEFGYSADMVVDYKGLRGDSSDNIPGVPGIGEKTATMLLTEYGSLDDIYTYIDTHGEEGTLKPGVYKKLVENKEDAYMSKELATIIRDVKLKYSEEDLAVEAVDYERVVALVQELGFKSLLNKIPKPETASMFDSASSADKSEMSPSINENDASYTLVDSEAKLKDFAKKLKKQKIFAVDTETTSINTIEAELLGLSFSWHAGEAYYLDFINLKSQILDLLSPILEDPKVHKVGHNIKYDYKVLKRAGITLNGVSFDTMIAAYMINPGSRGYKLDTLVFAEFGHQMMPIEDLIGTDKKTQITLKEVAVEKVAHYAAEDADYTWQLYNTFKEDSDFKEVESVFNDIEVPLIPVLGDMELRGVAVDKKFLENMSSDLGKEIKKLEEMIYFVAGKEFNVASPSQLSKILFEELEIPSDKIKKTKTGLSTAASELEKLKDEHEIIPYISQFRELSKLKNTYTDALPKLIEKETGRIHTNFNQTIAATGRLSSTDPNLQNIPIRTELGAKVRNAFVAEKGYVMLAADYSQIELRIAASLSKDKTLTEAFENGEDVHALTASRVFGVPLEDVTKDQRRDAKAVNFGVLYGLGANGLAQGTGMSIGEAKDFLNKYFELHPNIKTFIEETKAFAHSEGYTETLTGRRRYFPEIESSHPALRAAAERAAINLPVQGLNADIIKLAMLKLDADLKAKGLEEDIRMLLQVHDELVFEIKKGKEKEAAELIISTMEQIYDLKIPVVVDAESGPNWGACK